jgi:hypothetical protein
LPGWLKRFPRFLKPGQIAKDFSTDRWEFALTLDALYREGLSEADIRWLISSGLVEHAIEKTRPDAEKRKFLHIASRLIVINSCFVLTETGCVMAEKLVVQVSPEITQSSQIQTESLLPRWDSNVRELSLRSCLVKRFRTPAHCQEIVLKAFENVNWVRRIDNPLPKDSGVDTSQQLRDTVRRLNSNQHHFQKLLFSRDGTGNGICWEKM